MYSRRKFIKDSCGSCIAILAAGSVASLLSSCATISVYTASIADNLIQIPVESVLPTEKMKIIRVKSLTHDILLVPGKNKLHKSFLMKCTHQDTLLVANNNGLTCNLHGSTFNLKGEVTKGPASRPLKLLKTIEEDKFINIYLT